MAASSERPGCGDDLPLVSVVIPMRNEGEGIRACLDAVLAQDYPAGRIEVIVVDGESEDDSAQIVREYAKNDPRVRVFRNPRRIVPSSLNIGVRAAHGDVIVRVDGHTRIAPDYVRCGIEVLRRTGADNVGGPMHAVGGGGFGDAVAAAMSSRFGIGAYFHFGTEEREVDTVYLGMWPRAVFERVGLFDEELARNQDDEFNYRLRKLGGRVVLTPAMRSWYQNRQSVRRLARQFYEYGQWKVRILQKHPRQMSVRHFVPPALVAALSVLAILAGRLPHAGGAAAALALTYAGAVLAAALLASGRRGAAALASTAIAFAIIHLAWGSGFLSGLLRFSGRWQRPELAPPRLAPRPAGREPFQHEWGRGT